MGYSAIIRSYRAVFWRFVAFSPLNSDTPKRCRANQTRSRLVICRAKECRRESGKAEARRQVGSIARLGYASGALARSDLWQGKAECIASRHHQGCVSIDSLPSSRAALCPGAYAFRGGLEQFGRSLLVRSHSLSKSARWPLVISPASAASKSERSSAPAVIALHPLIAAITGTALHLGKPCRPPTIPPRLPSRRSSRRAAPCVERGWSW